EAAWRGSSVSLTATRHLLQQAVGLETLHSRLVQSLLKAFTNLGVGTNARCSLGHSMDRVPLPSLAVADDSPICHRCERTAEELLRAAGQEAPFEPWWKCRSCAAKGRGNVFLCTECARFAQATASEALLSKPVTKSWKTCMHVLRELLRPEDVRSSPVGSPCDTGEFTEDETLQSALAKESQGLEASMGTSETMRGLPVRERPNSAQGSSKSNDLLGREGSAPDIEKSSPHVVSEGSAWVEEVLEAAHKTGAVSSASDGVMQQDYPHPDVAETGERSDAPSASAEAEAEMAEGFQIPATFLTCPDDASVVSNVSLEDVAEPMPEPTPQPRLDLFVKLGELWTPTPIVRPKTEPEQPWVLDVPKKPVPERRTITKKLRLPVGPGLENVLLMGPRAPLGLPSTAGASHSRVKEARAGRRRDQQGYDADCCAKEMLRRAQKPPGKAPRTYAVAPQELFDEHVQAMDLPVWQGVVDSWNRRIRAAGESRRGTPDASADAVPEPAAQSELAATAAATRPCAPETTPTRKADGKYRVFDIAQWVRQSEQSKIWVDPDDIMQHYFEEACNVRRRKPQQDVLHDQMAC
ncbi:unnamed protein product, partial [Symbiodinium sp. KB8]